MQQQLQDTLVKKSFGTAANRNGYVVIPEGITIIEFGVNTGITITSLGLQ